MAGSSRGSRSRSGAGSPAGLDVGQRLADHAQRAQGQQVDLDQPGIFDAVLVPLADDAAGHGGRFERHHLVQRRAGNQHTAAVDGEMARAAVELAQQREQVGGGRQQGRCGLAHVRFQLGGGGNRGMRVDQGGQRVRPSLPATSSALPRSRNALRAW